MCIRIISLAIAVPVPMFSARLVEPVQLYHIVWLRRIPRARTRGHKLAAAVDTRVRSSRPVGERVEAWISRSRDLATFPVSSV